MPGRQPEKVNFSLEVFSGDFSLYQQQKLTIYHQASHCMHIL